MDSHPIQGGVEILPVTSCYRNRDKLRPDGPLGSYADFTPGHTTNQSIARELALFSRGGEKRKREQREEEEREEKACTQRIEAAVQSPCDEPAVINLPAACRNLRVDSIALDTSAQWVPWNDGYNLCLLANLRSLSSEWKNVLRNFLRIPNPACGLR